jgi:hypothetical protein
MFKAYQNSSAQNKTPGMYLKIIGTMLRKTDDKIKACFIIWLSQQNQ